MTVRRAGWLLGAACAAAVVTAVPRAAQEPDVPVFRAGVAAVRVDVSVDDRQDQPMTNLGPADFELREDGVVQQITSVQFIRRDGRRQTDLNEALTIRSREHAESEAARDDVRLFAVFLDDYHVDKDQQITLRLRDALQQFVKGFGPNDLLVVMDPLTPLSALRYTRDLNEVQARIRAFEGRRGQVYPIRSVMEEAQLKSANPWEIRASVTLSALEALVAHLGGLGEGRKSVLFVSQGPPVYANAGGGEARLQAIVQAANRGNVTIHAFDPRPLGNNTGVPYVLSRLASDTGGRAVASSNAPAPRLKEMLADASAYYLLGYTPSRTADDGRFHKIEVRVLRPGARVTARKGYWAPSAKETSPVPRPAPEPRQATALASLTKPASGRVAEVWLGWARRDGGRPSVTVAWDPAPVGPGAREARTLDVAALDGGPRPAGTPMRELEPARALPRGGSAGFAFEAGQAVVFRFSARDDANTVLDQWDQKVTVPDVTAGPVSMSTPAVFRASTPQQARVLERGPGLAPAASRRFRPSDRVRVDVEPYARDGAAVVVAEVLGAGGRSLVTLPVSDAGGQTVRIGVPVGSLGIGTYVLRLHASADGQSVEERIAFEVVP